MISVETRCGGGISGAASMDGAANFFFFGRFFLPSPFPMYRKLLRKVGTDDANGEDNSSVSVDADGVKDEAEEKHDPDCAGLKEVLDEKSEEAFWNDIADETLIAMKSETSREKCTNRWKNGDADILRKIDSSSFLDSADCTSSK